MPRSQVLWYISNDVGITKEMELETHRSKTKKGSVATQISKKSKSKFKTHNIRLLIKLEDFACKNFTKQRKANLFLDSF